MKAITHKITKLPIKMTTIAAAIVLAGLLLALAGTARGATSGTEQPSFEPPRNVTVPGQIIVKFKENAGSSVRAEVRSQQGLEKRENLDVISAGVYEVEGQSAEAAVRALNRSNTVEYATQDRKVYLTGYADEPRFSELWGLNNTGQAIDGVTGAPDMDVNGKEASARTQGDPNLVVAVIDSGVDFSHPDLADRAWKNPGESGGGKETNGIDDDNNGFVDDVNGADFFNEDGDPYDDNAHGTHVSGTIAASVNGQGIVGVAPNVKIMALKFINSAGGGTLSDAIRAIGYAKSKGATISNNSWGYLGPPDAALRDAIKNSGQLFVAAAGNDGLDGDAGGFASDVGNETFEGPAGTAFAGELYDLNSSTSLYFAHDRIKPAATSAAVIEGIYGGSSPGTWEYFNGTSMASPHVAGVAALVASKYPASSPTAVKSIVMNSGKKVAATTGKTVTGKMADARAALYPRVTATSPTAGATGVVRSANVTATFSEAMNATTIGTTTFKLVKAGTTTPVGATVGYDAQAKKATLDPGVDLAPGATYTATVKGGTSGVKNATPGDPMVANKTWKFTVSP
jgi:subtilisin family serine protease